MAKMKMKMDGHCPVYMLAVEPCGQISPSPFQEPSLVSSWCFSIFSKITVVQREEQDTQPLLSPTNHFTAGPYFSHITREPCHSLARQSSQEIPDKAGIHGQPV
ncbi:hypothetical protein V3481_007382 [Fusarium oxysporum f. sp. vasinfectum]